MPGLQNTATDKSNSTLNTLILIQQNKHVFQKKNYVLKDVTFQLHKTIQLVQEKFHSVTKDKCATH
jgi:hypothetical protein